MTSCYLCGTPYSGDQCPRCGARDLNSDTSSQPLTRPSSGSRSSPPPPWGPPGVAQSPNVSASAQGGRRPDSRLLIVVGVVLAIVILGALYLPRSGVVGGGSHDDQVTQPQATVGATDERSDTSGDEPDSEPADPPTADPIEFPGNVTLCSRSIAVNDVTSCEFAENVSLEYGSDVERGDAQITAFSSITEKWYDMMCFRNGAIDADTGLIVRSGPVLCRGGNNAEVYLR